MNISVIGNGYVGLATAVGLAAAGHLVTCIDREPSTVQRINEGLSSFWDPELGRMLSECVNERRTLTAVQDFGPVAQSDVIFVCVGTFSETRDETDLTNVCEATHEIGSVLRSADGYHLVVIKSTVPPGTSDDIVIPALEKCSHKKAGAEIGVAVNPEFLQEGRAIRCFMKPDRIVIGANDPRSGDMLQKVYKNWESYPVVRTDCRTAEMIKYASNAFLAAKLSFMNQIGNLCKALHIDSYEVARGMGFDNRIGSKFLNSGIGFGGSCLPKDLEELVRQAKSAGCESDLFESVYAVNSRQALKPVEIAKKELGSLESKTVAVLGLAFKPNTDDIRHAPALSIIARLLEDGALVKTYDPRAMAKARGVLPCAITFCASAGEAIDGSDAILIVTEWDEFKDETLYCGKFVVDGRRALDPVRARSVCERYEGVCW